MSKYIDAEKIPFITLDSSNDPLDYVRRFAIDMMPSANVVEKPAEEPYLEQMMEEVKRSEEDEEVAHSIADGILCDLLEKLGYERLVKAFDDVRKWYA